MAGGILTGKGINAQRRILDSHSTISPELRDLRTTSQLSQFLRAVVVDVLFDPASFPKEEINKLKETLANPEVFDRSPRDSILARIITDGFDHRDNSLRVFYPFFPPYLRMPVKPGEQVWVFYENPEKSLQLGYWIFRPTEAIHIDDINFTHSDRKFDRHLEDIDNPSIKNIVPSFINGGGTEDNLTLVNKDDYDVINREASANNLITKEPIPRYTKRPADLVIQGSNNALIALGEDRRGSAVKENDEIKEQAGTIDIVVGRGRVLPDPVSENVPFSPASKPEETAPPVVKNKRGKLEVDKEIFSPRQNNLREGDPDFENDASRLLLSQKTNGDANFGLEFPKLNGGETIDPISDDAYAILKSNQIRILARKSEETGEIGSIKIQKEGEEDEDRISIILDGNTIFLEGRKIIIGSGIEKGNGSGDQVYIGRDATESLVMGDTLKNLLNEYTTNIKTNITSFTTALTALNSAPLNLGNFSIPLPGMIAISIAATTLQTQINVSTQAFQGKINTILSKNAKTK